MAKARPAADPASALPSRQTEELADMFRLMGDPTRLRIVLACLPEPLAVGEIALRLTLSPSLVSHHLRLLRAGRILRGERRGRHVYYSAADEHVSRVVADMSAHVGEAHQEAAA